MKKWTKATRGYEQVLDYYQTGDCSNRPLKEKCNSSEGNRRIQVSHELNWLKQQAEQRLKGCLKASTALF